MSVDDENTIYVGDLPYDCTENLLRQVFELYGSIISVKIINNRDLNGSCFGYVTFTNPRSAVEAIEEMDGKTVGGRVVRVNVKSRSLGMRSMHGRGTFRPTQRNIGWVGGRGRGRGKVFSRVGRRDYSREHDGVRERWIDRSRDHSRPPFQRRDRDQSRELQNLEHVHSRSHDREPDKDHDLDSSIDTQPDRGADYFREHDGVRERWIDRSHDHSRPPFQRRDRDQSRELQNLEHVRSRSHDREPHKDHDLDSSIDTQPDRGADYDRVYDKNRELRTKRKHSSSYESYDRPSRDDSSEPSDHSHQEEESDIFSKSQDEIRMKKSDIEQRLEERIHQIADLRKRSMKLEDALTSAKKRTSMDQLHLTKLCKCSEQVNEYGEKLESLEQEFQDLVDSVSTELDPSIVGPREIYLRNGED